MNELTKYIPNEVPLCMLDEVLGSIFFTHDFASSDDEIKEVSFQSRKVERSLKSKGCQIGKNR